MLIAGDVDSADNEEETDSEVQIRTKNNHTHNHEDNRQKRYAYQRNNAIDPPNKINPNSSVTAAVSSPNCFISSAYGIIRPNQLLRAKVKHETKL